MCAKEAQEDTTCYAASEKLSPDVTRTTEVQAQKRNINVNL